MTPIRYRKVLTLKQRDELSDWELAFLRKQGIMPPIGGADGGDEADADADANANADADDDGDEGEDGDEDKGEDEDKERRRLELKDDETVVSKSEFERLKRIAKESEQKARKAEREAERRREQERRESGNWEEIVRERDEKLAEAEAEREAARLELDATLRSQRITAAAVRQNFRDPADAQFFLSEEETQDDASTERALKRLGREKPYLLSERKSSGAPVNGEGASLTIEEIKRMKPDEVNARWREVQQALELAGNR